MAKRKFNIFQFLLDIESEREYYVDFKYSSNVRKETFNNFENSLTELLDLNNFKIEIDNPTIRLQSRITSVGGEIECLSKKFIYFKKVIFSKREDYIYNKILDEFSPLEIYCEKELSKITPILLFGGDSMILFKDFTISNKIELLKNTPIIEFKVINVIINESLVNLLLLPLEQKNELIILDIRQFIFNISNFKHHIKDGDELKFHFNGTYFIYTALLKDPPQGHIIHPNRMKKPFFARGVYDLNKSKLLYDSLT